MVVVYLGDRRGHLLGGPDLLLELLDLRLEVVQHLRRVFLFVLAVSLFRQLLRRKIDLLGVSFLSGILASGSGGVELARLLALVGWHRWVVVVVVLRLPVIVLHLLVGEDVVGAVEDLVGVGDLPLEVVDLLDLLLLRVILALELLELLALLRLDVVVAAGLGLRGLLPVVVLHLVNNLIVHLVSLGVVAALVLLQRSLERLVRLGPVNMDLRGVRPVVVVGVRASHLRHVKVIRLVARVLVAVARIR